MNAFQLSKAGNTWGAETVLLLCCARTECEPGVQEQIRELVAGGINWSVFHELVLRHHMTPLVARHIAAFAPAFRDEPGVQAIVARARNIAHRNVYLTGELLRVLRLLDSQGIPAAVLKGPALAISAFGDLSSREFGDLDILVHPDDLARARNAISVLDYRPERESMTRTEEAAYIRSEHAFQHLRDRDQLVLEIHWRLHDNYLSFPFDTTELWGSMSTKPLFGRNVRCLSPEHLVLYLCMHGAKHYWERLEWICSLSAVMRSATNLRPGVLLRYARRLRGIRILRLGLMLADDLDKSGATTRLLTMLGPDPVASELVSAVWKHMGRCEIAGSPREVHRYRFYLKSREDVRDRLRLVRDLSLRLPHPDSESWNELPLPKQLWFLHYIFRPVRFFRKFGFNGLRGVISPRRIPEPTG